MEMAVGRCEYQGFAGQARVDVPGQLLRDDAIEFLGDNAPVEGVYFEPDFVGRMHEVDLACARIEDFELLVSREGDAGAG
jgi:hypothetical protein